jgi:hypothetical protein
MKPVAWHGTHGVRGVDAYATHGLPIDEALRASEMVPKNQDGCLRVPLRP